MNICCVFIGRYEIVWEQGSNFCDSSNICLQTSCWTFCKDTFLPLAMKLTMWQATLRVPCKEKLLVVSLYYIQSDITSFLKNKLVSSLNSFVPCALSIDNFGEKNENFKTKDSRLRFCVSRSFENSCAPKVNRQFSSELQRDFCKMW